MKSFLYSFIQAIKKRLESKKATTSIIHQKRIIVFIHERLPLKVSWVVLNNHDDIQDTVIHGDLSQLTALAMHYDIHVIIPGDDVLLTHAELPTLSSERLLKALPYALEDQLIEDISELHFAIAKMTQPITPVAIIKKKIISTYLESLNHAGLKPPSMTPNMLALPWVEKHWHITCLPTTAIVRTGIYDGFVCDRQNLSTLLPLKLDKKNQIEQIDIDCVSDEPVELHMDSIVINKNSLTEQSFLEKTALLFGQNAYINLLQGSYKPAHTATKTKKMWLFASVIAACWLLVFIVGQAVSYVMLSHENNALQLSINQIYHRHFPDATRVVAPRERMESALRKISSPTNTHSFLWMLALITQSMDSSHHIRFLSLNYKESHMNLIVSADSSSLLDAFIDRLNQHGLRAKKQNATITGNQIKADIFISTGDL